VTKLPTSPDALGGLRAARWIRESTPGQFDRYGPEAQIELQDAAIRRLGLEDTGLVWRAAHSGRTVYRSSEMVAMLDSARNGAFDVLLVGYVSRWQRNLRRTLELLEDTLHPAGVAVWFADEEILSSCDRHWDQLVDEAKDAERYSRRLARRIHEGYASKLAKQRDPGGHPPFGFRRNEAKLLEPDPDKADTVLAAFRRSAAGALDHEIAEALGLPIDTIRGMLLSPLYVGRLRDGSEAHWPALVPLELADKVAAVRAARATSTGRKASPSRPYALAMLHCAHCAKRISGDSGFYRHDKACPQYRAAQPDLPAHRRGRRDGKGYRRELIEDAVGVLLDRVSVNAHLVASVVGQVVPARTGPDEIVLRRIERERADAAARVVRDRDYEALRATMERLDREESAARVVRQTEGIPAERAVSYLQGLGEAWRLADGGPGRAELARSLFSRIDSSGFQAMRFHLTAQATAHGFAYAVPASFTGIVGYGRGERSGADTLRVFIRDPWSRQAEAAAST
jgi:DNA invertase Pin-like site-specific DNA recombinase